jgi:NitT/TauT family transport system ATP-binding protein
VADDIEVRQVSLEYDLGTRSVLAVDNVSFSVAATEFVCLIGPSGCGKTTILNMLAGFLRPTKGQIRIGGRMPGEVEATRGAVFQDFAQLFPWRTARGNVEFGMEVRRVPKAERCERAMEFLRLVGLDHVAGNYPHQLSGGQQQRVAIARALAYDPGVLLMDEPFAALDAMTRDGMQRLLAEIWQTTRKTVVYITHNVAEAAYLADKVIVMGAHPGSIREVLAIDRSRPRDPLGDDLVRTQRELLAVLSGAARPSTQREQLKASAAE